jgi:hypothetical protein
MHIIYEKDEVEIGSKTGGLVPKKKRSAAKQYEYEKERRRNLSKKPGMTGDSPLIQALRKRAQSTGNYAEGKTYSQFLDEAFKRTGKTIAFKVLHHGSDEDSVKSIKRTGPKPSPKGSEGPGHYVTPDRKKAEKYAEFTSKQRKKKPAVVSYRVSSKKVSKTDTIPKGLTDKKKTTSEKPVVQNTKTGHVAMDADYANKRMIRNPAPTIRKRK